MEVYKIVDTRNKVEYNVLRDYVFVFGTHNDFTNKVASMVGVSPVHVYALGGIFYIV